MFSRCRAGWVIVCILMPWVGSAGADVYKYTDASGAVYFTDAPLKGKKYRLQWQREARKLARKVKRNSLNKKDLSGLSSVSGGSAVSASLKHRRAAYANIIEANAQRYRLSPDLLHAVIRAESAYNPLAVSSAGAQGLMQLMPGTAARYGVKDSFNPIENIRGGAAYLRDLLDMFGQNVRLAVAGYNAGEGAVIKYGRTVPPYPETRGYVRKVMAYLASETSGRVVTPGTVFLSAN